MYFNNIDSLESLAKQLYPMLEELSQHLMPYGYCATYHTCNLCPFGKTMYKISGNDIRMCEVLLNLEWKLKKSINDQ